MDIQENIPLGRKTTMRIGGQARYFAELLSKDDVEEAVAFAQKQNIPLITLGNGSNTVFADGTINALVVQIKVDALHINENTVRVEAGKNLATLINELAQENLDLSALTGIPGSVGGAIFGNAGQGVKGIWIDTYVESVTAYTEGAWRTYTREECEFWYRESWFKEQSNSNKPVIIWSASFVIPSRPKHEIEQEIERLLQRRIETQPHIKTAGSCFKSTIDGTPAWQLIDGAGLRGLRIGDIQISEKHANFLLNTGKGTFEDLKTLTEEVKTHVPEIPAVEMRLYGENGMLDY